MRSGVAERAEVPAAEASHHFYQKRDPAGARPDIDLGAEGLDRPPGARRGLAVGDPQHTEADVRVGPEDGGEPLDLPVGQGAPRRAGEEQHARRAVVDERSPLGVGAALAHHVGGLEQLPEAALGRGAELDPPPHDEGRGADLGDPRVG